MNEPNNNQNSMKLLLAICEPLLIAKLLPLLWRLVAAVRSFFCRRDLTKIDQPIRIATGIHPARNRKEHLRSDTEEPRNGASRTHSRKSSVAGTRLSTEPKNEQGDRHAIWPDHPFTLVLSKCRIGSCRDRTARFASWALRRTDDSRTRRSRRSTRSRLAATGCLGRASRTLQHQAGGRDLSQRRTGSGQVCSLPSRRGGH